MSSEDFIRAKSIPFHDGETLCLPHVLLDFLKILTCRRFLDETFLEINQIVSYI